MGPLFSVFQKADDIILRVQMIPGPPRINYFTLGSDFLNQVAQHLLVALTRVGASIDSGYQVFRKGFKEQYQGVSIGQPLEIVVDHGIIVFPDHVAFPIEFPNGSRPGHALNSLPTLSGAATAEQQMTVGQHVSVADVLFRLPLVADATFHINQVGEVASSAGNQGITLVTILGRMINQPVSVVFGPAHVSSILRSGMVGG